MQPVPGGQSTDSCLSTLLPASTLAITAKSCHLFTRVVQDTLIFPTLPVTLGGRNCYFHFTDEEMEAPKVQ